MQSIGHSSRHLGTFSARCAPSLDAWLRGAGSAAAAAAATKYPIYLEPSFKQTLRCCAGVVDTLFISRQGHFSCPCRTGAVMLGSTSRALSPTASTSQLTRSLEARRSDGLALVIALRVVHTQVTAVPLQLFVLAAWRMLHTSQPGRTMSGMHAGFERRQRTMFDALASNRQLVITRPCRWSLQSASAAPSTTSPAGPTCGRWAKPRRFSRARCRRSSQWAATPGRSG